MSKIFQILIPKLGQSNLLFLIWLQVNLKDFQKIQILKKTSAINALEIIKNFKKISISGNDVDDALVSYVKKHHGIIATVDVELKKRIKNFGSVISLSNDKIVLEP